MRALQRPYINDLFQQEHNIIIITIDSSTWPVVVVLVSPEKERMQAMTWDSIGISKSMTQIMMRRTVLQAIGEYSFTKQSTIETWNIMENLQMYEMIE